MMTFIMTFSHTLFWSSLPLHFIICLVSLLLPLISSYSPFTFFFFGGGVYICDSMSLIRVQVWGYLWKHEQLISGYTTDEKMFSCLQEPLNACRSSGRDWASLAPPPYCEHYLCLIGLTGSYGTVCLPCLNGDLISWLDWAQVLYFIFEIFVKLYINYVKQTNKNTENGWEWWHRTNIMLLFPGIELSRLLEFAVLYVNEMSGIRGPWLMSRWSGNQPWLASGDFQPLGVGDKGWWLSSVADGQWVHQSCQQDEISVNPPPTWQG